MSDVNKKLGGYLKSKREAKGISIDEMADALKITTINITNIENGNIESIGLSEIFVRSYVKSYINEIGEAPDDVFNKFKEFQNTEASSIKSIIATSTILYNPMIQITGVIIFLILSYVFISSVVKRDKQLMNMEQDYSIKLEQVIDNESENKKTFSNDYDNTYSNYSETPR